MLTVPKKIALQRWDTLPDNIREVLVSEHSVETLERIAKDEHIPNEKVPEISRVAGYVFMGFLHPEEVAREIKEALGIDAKIAESISKSLASRLFAPFKSQIEKIYAPAFEEIKPAPRPIMIEEAAGAAKERVAERPAPRITPPAAPVVPQGATGVPRPKTLNELGGQGMGNLESNRMAVREVAPPKPARPFTPDSPNAPARPVTNEIRPPMAPAKVGEKTLGIIDEMQRLEHSGVELVDVLKKKELGGRNIEDVQLKYDGDTLGKQLKDSGGATDRQLRYDGETSKEPRQPMAPPTPKSTMAPPFQTPPPAAIKPAASSGQTQGPIIIHQELEPEPIRPMSSFHLEPPASKFSSPVSKIEERSPARVEIGGERSLPGGVARSEVIKPPRVVHYSTYQTPLENPPGVTAPKPPFIPQAPSIKPEAPQPTAAMPTLSIPRPQEAPKMSTVNYGFDPATRMENKSFGTPPPLGGASFGSFSVEPPKKTSWLKSIFSKKEELPMREVSFPIKPAPTIPTPPPVPRPTEQTNPPMIQNKPPVAPVPKTFDIKTTNPPPMGQNKEASPTGEEMIDLNTFKIER